MRASIMANVVLIFVVHVPNLLHHNNVGVTYAGTSNFRMEPIRYVPLYFMAMFQFMVIIAKAPFVTTLAHIIVGMKSRPWEQNLLVYIHRCLER
jgi:hypothetical protein